MTRVLTETQSPREQILDAMTRIYRYRMTTTSGGNISARGENGDIWITPARIDKGSLTAEDIVLVHADGSTEGRHPPSSELPLHQAIYEARPDVCGVVHAHPAALVAFSLVHQVPDTRLFHRAWQVCGEAGFAPYALPGTGALGVNVAGAFAKGHDCVILENHGVVTAGRDVPEAFRRFETFEFTGKTLLKARLLGRDVRYLNEAEIEMGTRAAERNGFTRGAISAAERELREQICGFVRRAYQLRLFISTQGSVSARLNESSFVITPAEADRSDVCREDLVLVEDGRPETGSAPSRAIEIHAAIYRRHPHVGAIINAFPVNATAFSVTREPVDTRTIPESYLVVRKPGTAGYALQFSDTAALAELISATQPALIVENGGVLVTGATVLEAYDRLEVLESTAEALIDSRALGPMTPMSDETVRELEAVYFKSGC